MPLTPSQMDTMRSLSNHVGKTVEVLTSQYDANVSRDFKPVAVVNAAGLRGLERAGYIRIENKYWKGATVTVLKGVEA